MEDPRSYHILHINTFIDRQSTDLTPSNVTTYLNEFINGGEKQLTCEVMDMQLPMLIYTFPTHSNVLWWLFTPDSVNAPNLYYLEYEIIPTDRNFNSGQELVDYLNPLCSDVSRHVAPILLSFSNVTSKITVKNNVPINVFQNLRMILVPSFRYGLEFTQIGSGVNQGLTAPASDAMDRLGFTQNMFTDNFNQWLAPQQSVEAESPIRLLRSSCYYLTLDEISSNTVNQHVPSPFKQPKILCKIPARPFGQIAEIVMEEPYTRAILAPTQLSTLTLKLLDDELYEVDLSNNSNICITLKIGYI
jgi:hypothetical protein